MGVIRCRDLYTPTVPAHPWAGTTRPSCRLSSGRAAEGAGGAQSRAQTGRVCLGPRDSHAPSQSPQQRTFQFLCPVSSRPRAPQRLPAFLPPDHTSLCDPLPSGWMDFVIKGMSCVFQDSFMKGCDFCWVPSLLRSFSVSLSLSVSVSYFLSVSVSDSMFWRSKIRCYELP